MGVLDDVWREEPKRRRQQIKKKFDDYDKSTVAVNCDHCGKVFKGQAWMLTTNKKLDCPDCYYNKNI